MRYTKEFLLIQVPREVHVLFFTVVALVCVSLAAVVFGQVDDVVKVRGIVRTQENVSSVKNVIAGKVTALYYRPGMKVHRGDVLFSVDPASYNAQHATLLAEKDVLEHKLSGIQAVIESFRQDKNLVPEQYEEYHSRFARFCNRSGELAVQREIALQKYLVEKGRPEVMRREKSIRMERLNYEYADFQLSSYRTEFSEKMYAEEKELLLSLSKNGQEIARLENQYESLCVTSPVDGYVQELAQLNTGDYVEAGKNVLNIVPDDSSNFRVELQIPPKDMGKIRNGLAVKFRLTAFPYFEYQGAQGNIVSVDPDIRSGDGKNLYYSVYADIDRTCFTNRKGQSFPVRAGLETNSRIVLEHSSILLLLLKKMDFLY